MRSSRPSSRQPVTKTRESSNPRVSTIKRDSNPDSRRSSKRTSSRPSRSRSSKRKSVRYTVKPEDKDAMILYFDKPQQRFVLLNGEKENHFPSGNQEVQNTINDLENAAKMPFFIPEVAIYSVLGAGIFFFLLCMFFVILSVWAVLTIITGVLGVILFLLAVLQLSMNTIYQNRLTENFEKMREVYKIRLSDFGLGISLEFKRHHFLKFYIRNEERASNPRKSRTKPRLPSHTRKRRRTQGNGSGMLNSSRMSLGRSFESGKGESRRVRKPKTPSQHNVSIKSREVDLSHLEDSYHTNGSGISPNTRRRGVKTKTIIERSPSGSIQKIPLSNFESYRSVQGKSVIIKEYDQTRDEYHTRKSIGEQPDRLNYINGVKPVIRKNKGAVQNQNREYQYIQNKPIIQQNVQRSPIVQNVQRESPRYQAQQNVGYLQPQQQLSVYPRVQKSPSGYFNPQAMQYSRIPQQKQMVHYERQAPAPRQNYLDPRNGNTQQYNPATHRVVRSSVVNTTQAGNGTDNRQMTPKLANENYSSFGRQAVNERPQKTTGRVSPQIYTNKENVTPVRSTNYQNLTQRVSIKPVSPKGNQLEPQSGDSYSYKPEPRNPRNVTPLGERDLNIRVDGQSNQMQQALSRVVINKGNQSYNNGAINLTEKRQYPVNIIKNHGEQMKGYGGYAQDEESPIIKRKYP